MPLNIQLRHDTAANWLAADPVLMAGEVGIDLDTGKIKIGNGSDSWTELPFALTGPEGPAGPPALALSGPVLITPAGAPLLIQLLTRDAYTDYIVQAGNGQVSLEGNTITYIGQALGTDTLTLYAGDAERSLSVEVIANTLGDAPSAPPSFGAPTEGGFYAGAIWDTVTTATGAVTVGTGVVTVTIAPADLPSFYLDQRIRLATTDSRNAILEGRVIAGSGDQLTVELDTVLAGTLGASYSGWVVVTRWRVIVAPKSSGENASVAWKTSNTSGPTATRTLTNGRAATASMEAENTAPSSPVYPLARWISALNALGGINGYTDWYIPARDELELLWRDLKPVTNNNYTTVDRANGGTYTRDGNFSDASAAHGTNRHSDPPGGAYTAGAPAQTAAAAFQAGGAEALSFGSAYYWSSSEFSATSGWSQYYRSSNPGYQNDYAKTASIRARAVRRSIL